MTSNRLPACGSGEVVGVGCVNRSARATTVGQRRQRNLASRFRLPRWSARNTGDQRDVREPQEFCTDRRAHSFAEPQFALSPSAFTPTVTNRQRTDIHVAQLIVMPCSYNDIDGSGTRSTDTLFRDRTAECLLPQAVDMLHTDRVRARKLPPSFREFSRPEIAPSAHPDLHVSVEK